MPVRMTRMKTTRAGRMRRYWKARRLTSHRTGGIDRRSMDRADRAAPPSGLRGALGHRVGCPAPGEGESEGREADGGGGRQDEVPVFADLEPAQHVGVEDAAIHGAADVEVASLVGLERVGYLGARDHVDVDFVAVDEEPVGDVGRVEDEGDGVALLHVDDAGG